jgi:nucleoside-diphosphate-sugar epimerase
MKALVTGGGGFVGSHLAAHLAELGHEVFGPRQDPVSQYSAVIANFITALFAGEPPSVFGDLRRTIEYDEAEGVPAKEIAPAR